jgi:hypothetical protein
MSEEKDYFDEIINSGPYREALATMEKERNIFFGILERLAKAEQENEFLRRNGEPTSWRCFHCNEVFTDAESAALHFGSKQSQDSICTLDATNLRKIESQLESYQEEDTDLHREINKAKCEYQLALQRAEEAGYARGLKDAALQPLPRVEEIKNLIYSSIPEQDQFDDDADLYRTNLDAWSENVAIGVLEFLKGK